MNDQGDAAHRMAFFQQLAREAAAAGPQDECNDPTALATRTQASVRATVRQGVTMTEVYEDEPGWGHPSGW